MLKLTNSFYRYLGLTCEKVNKTHVRRFSHLNLCTGRADINLTAQFHSSLQLLQPGHRKKRLKIKIPPLDLHKCKKPNPTQMSDHLHPTIMHTSYGGQFEVTASNFQNNQAWQKGATASSSQGSWTYNNIPPGFRAWEIIGDGRNNSHGPTLKFKVLSYNLLAQYLLDCHPYLYTECWPLDLNWNTRASRLFEEITNESPDILCLQEVQESHLDTFFSKFEQMGYNKVFKKKTGQREDGCAIYFKSSIFLMVSYITVEFNQPELPLLNRDNVGLMVKLVPYAMPDSPVVVATTHLLYNPNRPDVRLAQMQVFLAELDRFTFFKRGNETRFLPFILTGDFNSTPVSDVIKLLEKGTVNAGPHRDASDWRRIGVTDNCQHLSVLVDRQQGRDTNFSKIKLHNTDILPDESTHGHSAGSLSDQFNAMFNGRELSHSLKVASVYDSRNTATTFQNQWITVDYIYYSTCSPLTLVGRLRLPSQEECEVLGRLPNHMYASDHLALAAAFELSYAPLHQEQAH